MNTVYSHEPRVPSSPAAILPSGFGSFARSYRAPSLAPSAGSPPAPSDPAAMAAPGNSLPAWKRAIDLGACFVALPVLALCTLAMAVVTRLVSPGPVFFRQERIGYRGRRFRIFKFRTMRVAADTTAHQAYFKELIDTNAPMMKLDSRRDARLLPGAWILRATGLDELPQILNVLRGEMSLVGPRPCIPTEFEQYAGWQCRRCDAVPGLTGLWQVSGKNRTTFDEMIRLDIRYSRELSFWLDVKIILLTPACLVRQVADVWKARLTGVAPAAPAPTATPSRSP